MVTKGIIQTIDFNGNTCTVRLPYFETASINDPVILNATLLIIPGVYNGYKPNDVVLVAFEDGQINTPVVVGKLFLGANKESAEPRGAINVANLKVGQEATIPVDTKLTYAGDDKTRAAVAKDLSTYKTVADIIKSIQNHSEKIGSATAQLIDDGIKLGAKVDKVNDGSTTGFGWELTDSGWAIFARNSDWALRDRMNLMTVDSEGTTFLGKVKILDYPIDTETRYKQLDAGIPADQPTNDTWKDWIAEMPPRKDGKYIWSCVKTVKYIKDPDNPNTLTEQTTYSKPVRLSGVDGKDGIGVKKVIDLFIQWEKDSEKSPKAPNIKAYSDPIKWTYKDENNKIHEWHESTDGQELTKGQTWWTCIATVYTDNSIKYSAPIKNNAYALAQGKSTNYYSDTDPSLNKANILKEGDCWFDTGYVKMATNPDKKAGYLGKFIVLSDGTFVDNVIPVRAYDDDRTRYISSTEGPDYIVKITPDNINEISIKENTAAYETGNLKQCSGFNDDGTAIWTDIAGELVTNKLTAKYINAMDITTKKITVLDKNNNKLFEADDTKTVDENGQVIKDSSVTIAGWNATKDSLIGGDEKTGTYTKIQIPNTNTNAANSLVSPFDLFELKVLTGDTYDTGGTLTDYSLVPEGQINLRKQSESNPLLERDNYYAWDIIPKPKSDNDTGTSNPPPHLAIVKLTYKNDTPLYNFNIYLSGLFNTALVDGKETSVNFIAATDIFNIGKIKEYGYIGESQLLEVLCYANYSNGKWNPPPSKLNPLYVLTMNNTSLFYTGKVNYIYPQINKGDWLYIIQYVNDPRPKKIPGATPTGISTAYDDIQTNGNSVDKYNRGTFFIERKIDTSKNVFDVSSNFRVSELGNLQSRQSLRAYNTVRADKIECGSWKLWPEQLMKEGFELRSNQIKLSTARSAKFYDKTTLIMRARSNAQADEAAKAGTSTNTVISQGELSCDHALSIRGKNHIRLSALDAMPTTDAEAQMVISAIPEPSDKKESMVCAAMVVSSEVHSTGGTTKPGGPTTSVNSVPGIGDITNPGIGGQPDVKPGTGGKPDFGGKPDVGGQPDVKPGTGGKPDVIIKPVPWVQIKIKVACIPNANEGLSMISSPRYVTVYCLCNDRTYTIKGQLWRGKPSFEETITVIGMVEKPLSPATLKFRWATYGSWSSQTKKDLLREHPGFTDAFGEQDDANIGNSCSEASVITITKVNDVTKTVGFNSDVIPLTSHVYSLGDDKHYWTGIHTQEGVKTSSDLRLKKDIKQLTAQDFSAFYDKLQPVSFRFKTDDETAPTRLGFIAQDVETALAETDHADLGIVSKPKSENGYYGLCYEQFIMLNMLQIKQLKKDLAALRQKYDALEKAVDQKNQKER